MLKEADAEASDELASIQRQSFAPFFPFAAACRWQAFGLCLILPR